MTGRVELGMVLLLLATPTFGLLMGNENNPALIDRFLQLIWEPSSLIRMWVGLDQLYNIALSWRGVAKSLASLPFSDGHSDSHVMIQQPRSFKYHKPSVASQWDRFNEIYASSSLSPILAPNNILQRGSLLSPGQHIDPLLVSKLSYFQNQAVLRHPGAVGVVSDPQRRLADLLGLLRTLGDVHTNEVTRKD